MLIRQVVRLFKRGNVSVFGLRGNGKDMLTANVIVRRKLPYISNVDYGGQFIPLNFKDIDCGGNTWKNFVDGNLHHYEFPFPDHTDVYLSDAGIYLPAQYCNEINRYIPFVATYAAISRHLALGNFHVNSQALGRVYDKIREQSDIYIRCMFCKVFGKLVIQRIITYDRYQAAQDCVPPFDLPRPLLNPTRRLTYDLAKQNYYISHGEIRSRWLIYFNRSSYNTRLFKELLQNAEN